MKWSPILHDISAITGILGVLSLFAWGLASIQNGQFLWISKEHAHKDAVLLFLVSIAFGIGTLIHEHEEVNKEISQGEASGYSAI